MTLIIESPRIYTRNGVPITVTGVAQVSFFSPNKPVLAIKLQTNRDLLVINSIVMDMHISTLAHYL